MRRTGSDRRKGAPAATSAGERERFRPDGSATEGAADACRDRASSKRVGSAALDRPLEALAEPAPRWRFLLSSAAPSGGLASSSRGGARCRRGPMLAANGLIVGAAFRQA